jgi:O-acetylserine/cysteine efflux transporter
MLLPLFSGSLVRDVAALGLVGWVSLLYLSLLSTVIGYSLFYTLLGRWGVSSLMVQLYLAPLVSVVGGALILGESVTALTVLGGVAMLTAVWLATTARKA